MVSMDWAECMPRARNNDALNGDFGSLHLASSDGLTTTSNGVNSFPVPLDCLSRRESKFTVSRKGKIRKTNRVAFLRSDVKPPDFSNSQVKIVVPTFSVLAQQFDYLESLVVGGNAQSNGTGDSSPNLNADGPKLKKQKKSKESDSKDLVNSLDKSNSKTPVVTAEMHLLLCLSELNQLNDAKKTQSLYQKYRQLAADLPGKVTCFANHFCKEVAEIKKNESASDSENLSLVDKVVLYYNKFKAKSSVSAVVLSPDESGGTSTSSGTTTVTTTRESVSNFAALHPTAGVPEKIAVISALTQQNKLKALSSTPDSASESFYPPHLPLEKLQDGLSSGLLFQGILRMRPNTWHYGTVTCHNSSNLKLKGKLIKGSESSNSSVQIEIEGTKQVNRGCEGDLVVVEILDKPLASDDDKEALNLLDSDETNPSPSDEGTVAQGGIDLTDDVVQSKPSDTTTKYGRIVGILRRNWRELAGTLRPIGANAEDIYGGLSTILETDSKTIKTAVRAAAADQQDRTFVPVDPKYPEIRIPTRESSLLDGKRILAKIDSWDLYSRYPRGHWTKVLGDLHDRKTESEVILHEHGINTKPFSDEAYACLPRADFYTEGIPKERCPVASSPGVGKEEVPPAKSSSLLNQNSTNVISPAALARRLCKKVNAKRVPVGQLSKFNGRVDLTHIENLCSVDPPGCKDIDDALSCEGPFSYTVKDQNSGSKTVTKEYFRVGVHIADVTYFLKPDTALDKEAQQRCTTVYLVERRTDMLPSLLTTDLCSLVGGQPRLSFSVFWELDAETGEQREGVEPEFCKGVILSRGALSYQQAQNRIDAVKTDSSILTKGLRNLNELAKKIRKKRKDAGALELASQEMKFELNENQDPTAVKEYIHYDTNRMVEEMMLLANTTVAKKILTAYPGNGVLRRHPTPKLDALEGLGKIVEEKIAKESDESGGMKLSLNIKDKSGSKSGFKFRFESNRELAETLEGLTEIGAASSHSKVFTQLVKMMTTRCMNQAIYFSTGDLADQSQFCHYGLAMGLYTHFTSPIRRYADVLVHRLLQHALGVEEEGVADIWKCNGGEAEELEKSLSVDNDSSFGSSASSSLSTPLSGLPPQLQSRDRLKEQCERINLKHKMAQWCGRASGDFHTYLFFHNLQKSAKYGGKAVEGVEGIVTRVQNNSVSVNVPRYGIEGTVKVGSDSDSKENGGDSDSLNSGALKVFDRVLLKIEAKDRNFRNKTNLIFQGKL